MHIYIHPLPPSDRNSNFGKLNHSPPVVVPVTAVVAVELIFYPGVDIREAKNKNQSKELVQHGIHLCDYRNITKPVSGIKDRRQFLILFYFMAWSLNRRSAGDHVPQAPRRGEETVNSKQ